MFWAGFRHCTSSQQHRDYFDAQILSIGVTGGWMAAQGGVMRNSIAEAQPLIRTQKFGRRRAG
jgi:hypothetical protein